MRAKWCGPKVYDVAQQFVASCLRENGSLFTPGRTIWTLELAESLDGHIGDPDTGSGTFVEKLKAQLSGAEPDGVQLGAEILYLQLLAEDDVSGELKLKHIEAILELAPGHASVPPGLRDALNSGGVASYGAGKTFRDAYVRFLLRFAIGWKELDQDAQTAACDDPWAFLRLVERVRTSTDAMTANALLHLVFPETFEYVIAPKDRRALIKAFRSAPGVSDSGNDNERLAQIRMAATTSLGRDVELYEDPFKRIWREDTSPAWAEMVSWAKRLYARDDFDEVERDYKLGLAEKVETAREELAADGEWAAALKRALTASENNLVSWRAGDEFAKWALENPDETRRLLTLLWTPADQVAAMQDFLKALPREAVPGQGTRISLASYLLLGTNAGDTPFFKPGVFQDVRKTLHLPQSDTQIDPDGIYRPEHLAKSLGIDGKQVREFLRSEFERDPGEKGNDWVLTGDQAEAVVDKFSDQASPTATVAPYLEWVELLEELRLRMLGDGISLRDLTDAQSLAYWVVQGAPPVDWSEADKAALFAFREGTSQVDPGQDGDDRPPPPQSKVVLPAVTAGVAADLHLPEPWLQDIVDLLGSKRQLIFYGPPGTGKTFVAQRIGEHLVSNGGAMRLVQFHPSYTYEDFFEGYRPEPDGAGAIGFELVPGVLRELAKEAELQPDTPHVLVIDEINRGNIAKIFGELYYLLEYRNKSIQLQYSRAEDFSIPENLLVIGTMNTADRSIALVDGALRRRFNFVEFDPTEEPVRSVLGSWLRRYDLDPEPAALLDALNLAIDDSEFSIGPSYFITQDRTEPDLESVWRHAIVPLLEERYYGSRRDVKREFGLKALRRMASNEADSPAGEDDQPLDQPPA